MARRITAALSILAASIVAPAASAQEVVRIYDGGWENIQINAAIASYVLENALDIRTEIVPSDVPDMQEQMAAGTMHLNMEMWRSLMNPWVTARLEEGEILDLGPTYEKAVQAFFVPTYVVEGDAARNIEPLAPELRRVDQLGELASAFALGEGGGEWLNCIEGWACREPNRVKMVTYGASGHFDVVEPASEAELNAEISRRYANGEPFVTYDWDPSPLLGRLDMTQLEEPAYTPACQAAIDAAVEEWEPGRGAVQACAYETVPISKFVTDEFAQAHPRAVEVLRRMTVGTETVRRLAGYMVENDLSPRATALHFFQTRPDLWTSWLDDAEVASMKNSLTPAD
ncbi:glycine betaine ABC transporter substrate-binding protein [Salinarimonas chemoclinalis]|uniref:glycine betaine ABC transporter substrate-binding protein n=1 Tax=Salinarimonas chemoclinalis TaxID=3241599 RepID=UPI0035569148